MYRTPPAGVLELVDRPPTPSVSLSPDAEHLVIAQQSAFKTLEELAQPELGLAGRQINPKTNGPSRDAYFTSFSVLNIATRAQKPVTGIPKGERLGGRVWAPDSKRFAFAVTRRSGIALYVADIETAKATRVTDYDLNAAVGSPCEWLSDSRHLVCRRIPKRRGKAPERSPVPDGPVIQESAGKEAPARTYTYLLTDEHDELLFDHYFTAQIAIVGVDGSSKNIGKPGIIVRASPSPNGKQLMVQTIHRPYSYLVPLGRFPRRTEIWSRAGNVIRKIGDEPLKESVPIAFGSVPDGRRSFGWRADADATVCFVEALDGGDARKPAKRRDRVFSWPSPYRGRPKKLMDTELRFGGVTWGTGQLALLREWWWKNRRTRTWIVAPDRPRTKPRLLWDRTWEDRYSDPGNPVTMRNDRGRFVLKTADDGKTLFLIGTGASEEGNRPFLDTLDLESKSTERLWRSRAPFYEYPVRILDDSGRRVLTRRESKQDPPNYFILDTETDKVEPVTEFPHPHPELKKVKKELIRYKRKDGVMLTATLYTPPNWTKSKGRLPLVMWAYPREFKSADAAGQVTDSPYRFSRVGWWSPLVWLLRGYAVLEGPTMPIVGEGDAEPNDTYIEQLVASAKAAVDEVVRRGVADRNRIAVGGHSYGAFMTANLLAHSNLFRAGIARSGAYNRTLTPFGFQSEERTFWQAPQTYFEMSPFVHADKIDKPLLLIHGEADPNSGTYPMQSERLYNAVKGHGGYVRLIMLPHEGHAYRARASIMHMLWETSRWLDTHVKKRKRKKSRRK